jgi:predicted RNA binding protein YcfA (HicA-like mRNA interferase family)
LPKITPISHKKLGRVFELAGFTPVRQKGDHRIYTKTGVKRPVIIPLYKEIPVFIILNNLRVAGLNRDDYFKLLKRV